MVGWVIRLFSFNLIFESDLFIRLGSVLLGSIATYLMFLIGKEVKNDRTGLIAAILYSASLYGGVITGIFIMPDSPQSVFWLAALLIFIKILPKDPAAFKYQMLLAGLLTGLAIYSKYHAIFLWVGAGTYILLFNRNWLKSKYLYFSVLISLFFVGLIFYWNYQNDFISFTYHEKRVSFFSTFRPSGLIQELMGELFYQNPINYILIIISLITFKKYNRFNLSKPNSRILLLFSLPLWGLVIFMSLFQDTLPHWSGPAFFALTIIAAANLDQKSNRFIPRIAWLSFGFYLLIIVLGISAIKFGLYFNQINNDVKVSSHQDVTLELFGWEQINHGFEKIKIEHPELKSNTIIGTKWYPASHIDFYVAQPQNMKMLVLGSLDQIHQYYWINEIRGELKPGQDAWYIATERYYQNPNEHFKTSFETVEPIDTITIYRAEKAVELVYVYYLKTYRSSE
jgi:4-amino-4-deoxy-L-arabinose transferase-like glycosyltransferase